MEQLVAMQMNPEWLFPVSDSHAYMDVALDGQPTHQRQHQDTKAEIQLKTIPKYLELAYLGGLAAFFFLNISFLPILTNILAAREWMGGRADDFKNCKFFQGT